MGHDLKSDFSNITFEVSRPDNLTNYAEYWQGVHDDLINRMDNYRVKVVEFCIGTQKQVNHFDQSEKTNILWRLQIYNNEEHSCSFFEKCLGVLIKKEMYEIMQMNKPYKKLIEPEKWEKDIFIDIPYDLITRIGYTSDY